MLLCLYLGSTTSSGGFLLSCMLLADMHPLRSHPSVVCDCCRPELHLPVLVFVCVHRPGVPDIADQIKEDNGNSVAFAIVGGFILSIGNICMQYSVALLGLSVGMPFICALTIVVGKSGH